MDSFRLVKYEISTPKPCFEAQKVLLQQRHNAAPGMVLVSTPTAALATGCVTLPSDPTRGHKCSVKELSLVDVVKSGSTSVLLET